VNERNEPLEQALCNVPAQQLSIPEALQLKNLERQMNHILWPGNYSELRHVLGRREKQLQQAIYEIPLTLVEQFSLEQRKLHLEFFEYGLLYKPVIVYTRRGVLLST
jgi:hypothetical protein